MVGGCEGGEQKMSESSPVDATKLRTTLLRIISLSPQIKKESAAEQSTLGVVSFTESTPLTLSKYGESIQVFCLSLFVLLLRCVGA